MDQTLDEIVQSKNIKFNGRSGRIQNNTGMQFNYRPQQSFRRPTGFIRKNIGFRRFNQTRSNFGAGSFVQRRPGQFVAMGQNRDQGFAQQGPQLRQQSTNFRMANMGNRQQSFTKNQRQQNSVSDLPPTKVYISNLDTGVTNQDLRDLFAEFGYIVRYGVNFSAAGRSLGTGEIVFKDKISATKAVQRYNGVAFDGRPMNLTVFQEGQQQPMANQQRFLPQGRGKVQTRNNNSFGFARGVNQPMSALRIGNNQMTMKRNFASNTIAPGAIRHAKNILRAAALQGQIGSQREAPDVNQLDADLDAYNAGKEY